MTGPLLDFALADGTSPQVAALISQLVEPALERAKALVAQQAA